MQQPAYSCCFFWCDFRLRFAFIDRFHLRGKQLCKFVGTKTFFYITKVSIPNGCFLYTNMAVVFIVLYTNMAAVTSGETIYTATCEVRDKATGEDGEGAEGEREKVWLTRYNLLVVPSPYEQFWKGFQSDQRQTSIMTYQGD